MPGAHIRLPFLSLQLTFLFPKRSLRESHGLSDLQHEQCIWSPWRTCALGLVGVQCCPAQVVLGSQACPRWPYMSLLSPGGSRQTLVRKEKACYWEPTGPKQWIFFWARVSVCPPSKFEFLLHILLWLPLYPALGVLCSCFGVVHTGKTPEDPYFN